MHPDEWRSQKNCNQPEARTTPSTRATFVSLYASVAGASKIYPNFCIPCALPEDSDHCRPRADGTGAGAGALGGAAVGPVGAVAFTDGVIGWLGAKAVLFLPSNLSAAIRTPRSGSRSAISEITALSFSFANAVMRTRESRSLVATSESTAWSLSSSTAALRSFLSLWVLATFAIETSSLVCIGS